MAMAQLYEVLREHPEAAGAEVVSRYNEATGTKSGAPAVAIAVALGLIRGRRGRGVRGYTVYGRLRMRPLSVALTAVVEAGEVSAGDLRALGVTGPYQSGLKSLGFIRQSARGWWVPTAWGCMRVEQATASGIRRTQPVPFPVPASAFL